MNNLFLKEDSRTGKDGRSLFVGGSIGFMSFFHFVGSLR